MPEFSDKSINDFTLLTVIGKGCYGKILLVKQNKTQKVYAMKVLKKKILTEQNKIHNIFTERNLLIEFDHPFIIKIVSTFQDDKKIYFVLEYCPGGQLYNLLSIKEKFTQQQVKFYIAQIVLALRYIHKKEIVYRDLKPENILIDKEGYVKLTDFGLSKKIKKNQLNKFSLAGMPEYMAPQILNNQDCGRAVDFWCLGSLMYQMLTGSVPFYSQNLNQLYDSIKNKQFVPDKETEFSPQCIDLLRKLFIKDPTSRLGMNEREIENHQWFSGINWEGVLTKKYRAPFVPILQSEDDTSYFCPEITESSVHSVSQYDQSHSQDHFPDDKKFEGFDYNAEQQEEVYEDCQSPTSKKREKLLRT